MLLIVLLTKTTTQKDKTVKKNQLELEHHRITKVQLGSDKNDYAYKDNNQTNDNGLY